MTISANQAEHAAINSSGAALAPSVMTNAPLNIVNQPTMIHMPDGAFIQGRIQRQENTDAAYAGTRYGSGSTATFNFLFNPAQVTTITNFNSAWDFLGDTPNLVPPPMSMQTISFDLLLIRDIDTATGAVPQGTLHDLEVLWRVFNGKPERQADGTYSSDQGWLSAIIVQVQLGSLYGFQGYCTGLNVNHVRFNPNMTPVYTEVSLGFSRIVPGATLLNGSTLSANVTQTDLDRDKALAGRPTGTGTGTSGGVTQDDLNRDQALAGRHQGTTTGGGTLVLPGSPGIAPGTGGGPLAVPGKSTNQNFNIKLNGPR